MPRDDEGSLMVELVVMMPVLFMLGLCLLAFGRLSEAHQLVVEASRAGAQAASVQPTSESAVDAAGDSAVVGVFGQKRSCANATIKTNVSQFEPGGYVTVSVTCQVNLSDLTAPGVPGTTDITASSTAPIDPYRSVGP